MGFAIRRPEMAKMDAIKLDYCKVPAVALQL